MTEAVASKVEFLPYQEIGSRRAVDEGGLHLSMEMGTGKTPTSIGAVIEAIRRGDLVDPRVLVVMPVSLLGQWREEIVKFWPEHLPINIIDVDSPEVFSVEKYDRRKATFWKPMTRFYLVGYDRLVDVFERYCPEAKHNAQAFRAGGYIEELPEELRFDVVVLDEATRIKNPKALATRVCLNLGRGARFRLALSGTPMPNGPEDILSQIEFVRPGLLREEGLSLHSKVSDALSRTRLRRVLDRCTYRVRKDQCLKLPAKSYVRREVALTDQQQELYRAFERELMVEIDALQERGRVWLPNVLVKLQACQQVLAGFVPWRTEVPDVDPAMAARLFVARIAQRPLRLSKNPKLEELLLVLEEAGDSRVVVFCKFIEEIRLTAERVAHDTGRSVLEFHGEVSPALRTQALARFKEDPRAVLAVQERTGGFGLNLVEAHLAWYMTNDWSWGVRAQSEDRIHRFGQSLPCTYGDIIAKGTIDERILRVVQAKREIAADLLDAA